MNPRLDEIIVNGSLDNKSVNEAPLIAHTVIFFYLFIARKAHVKNRVSYRRDVAVMSCMCASRVGIFKIIK